MANPNAKIYLATKEMQQATNDKVDGVKDTVHADITAVSRDIHDNFSKPSLAAIGDYIIDFLHDSVTIRKGTLMPDGRLIIC